MRYITDSNGYIKELSFGATITCGGSECTEYTGSIPDGYESLEDWYLAECDKLYRWQIIGGELTLDKDAEAPADDSSSGTGTGGVLCVTLTDAGSGAYTADKTIDEIIKAYNNGYEVVAAGKIYSFSDTIYRYPLISISESKKVAIFECTTVAQYGDSYGMSGYISSVDHIEITEDGVSFTTNETNVGLPTGGTSGQVLTIGSDGSPVWADPTTLTSVYEGVF